MSKRIVLISVFVTMVMGLAGMSASVAAIDTSEAMAFLYEALSYVPLNSTASFLGAQLGWDAAKGQAVLSYGGQDLALTPNSLKALFAGQPVVLPAPPVVVNGVTYVPATTLKKYYNVPVVWDRTRSEVKMKGPTGWRTWKASSRAPWHGGPPPWAPAWGRRGHDSPGHPSDGKARVSEKAKDSKAPAWGRRGHDAPGHPSKEEAKGHGKAKGNKKDR